MNGLRSFLNYLEFEKRYSPHTLEAYQNDLLQLQDFLSHTYQLEDLKEVQALHLRAWLVALHEQGLTNRSINRKISTLKSYYHFLRKRHGLDRNPVRKLVSPRTEKRLPLVVRSEQMERLLALEQTGDPGFSTSRDALVTEILYGCGLRRSELIQLGLNDIDAGRNLLRVEGKGKKERWLPLSPALINKINHYIRLRRDYIHEKGLPEPGHLLITDAGEPLYPKWVYNRVKAQLGLVTSITRRSPHILRHSFATHLSDAGADLNAVKTLLGHASLAATQVYMHNSVEKLKEIYRQAHPKS